MVLQSLAAATSDLWPSIANTLAIPWRASIYSSPAQKPALSRVTVAHHASSPAATNLPRHAQHGAVSKAKTELPGCMRDAVLSSRFLDLGLANASPINILSEISNMSPRSLAMANPLIRRSYSALMTRPLTTFPGVRSMSTYQPSCMQNPSWITTQAPSRNIQYRRFGTGGVSRDLLANRESAANRNPNSATAQTSFYQLLIKANMPAIVIERYQSGGSHTNSFPCD